MSDFRFHYRDSELGCGTVILLMLLIAAIIFCAPLVVMKAWELIAVVMFKAPAMSYWAAFFGTWAMHIIFRAPSYSRNKE